MRRLTALRQRHEATRDRDRGAITVIVALSLMAILAATALSFDIGHQVSTNRTMQAVADVVTLDTAATLDGGYAGSPDSASTSGQTLAQFADAQAVTSARRNSFDPSNPNNILTVQLGTYTTSGGFVAMANTDTSTPPNAVRVGAQTTTPYAFAVGSGASIRTATAVRQYCSGSNPNCNGGCAANSPNCSSTTQCTAGSNCTSTQCPTGSSSCTTTQCTTGSSTCTTTQCAVGSCPYGNGGCVGTCCPTSSLCQCPTMQPTNCAISGFTIGSYAANLDTTQSTFLNSLLSQTLGLSAANLQAVSYQGLAASNVTLNDLLSANAGVGTLNSLVNTAVTPGTLLGYLAKALAAVTGADPQGTAQTSVQTVANTTSTTKITLCKVIQLSTSSVCNPASPAPAASTELNALDFVRLVAEAANGSSALTFNGGVGLGLITATGSLISPLAVAQPGPATNAAGNHPVTATDQQGAVTLSVNTGVVSINLVVTAAKSTGTLTTITCGPTLATTHTTINVSSTAAVVSPTIGVTLLGVTIPVAAAPVSAGANSGTLTFSGPFNAQNTQSTGSTEPNIAIAPSATLTSPVSAALTPVLTLLNPLVSPLLAALGVNLGGATVANNNLTCGLPSLVG